MCGSHTSCPFFYQVVEDNMTDALKINIQQEVAVLQNKVMLVENENNKLLHDLPIINSEKMKLLIMKDNFFATTEERVTKHSQLEASELKARSKMFFINALIFSYHTFTHIGM